MNDFLSIWLLQPEGILKLVLSQLHKTRQFNQFKSPKKFFRFSKSGVYMYGVDLSLRHD